MGFCNKVTRQCCSIMCCGFAFSELFWLCVKCQGSFIYFPSLPFAEAEYLSQLHCSAWLSILHCLKLYLYITRYVNVAGAMLVGAILHRKGCKWFGSCGKGWLMLPQMCSVSSSRVVFGVICYRMMILVSLFFLTTSFDWYLFSTCACW